MFKIYSILLLCFILCVHFHTWNISLNSLTATPDSILTSPYLGAPTPCAEMWVLPLCDILRIHVSKANPVRSGFKPPREVDWLNAHSIRIGSMRIQCGRDQCAFDVQYGQALRVCMHKVRFLIISKFNPISCLKHCLLSEHCAIISTHLVV